MLHTRDKIHAKLRSQLLKAQTTMKQYTDRHRRDVHYDMGQLVYVKLRPYRQSSYRGHHHPKLAKRYFGPFRVLERIGSVAYHLQLLLNSKLHPVFHYSLLRAHHGPLDLLTSLLPLDAINHHPILEPLTILSSREDPSTSPPTRMVLVQWEGLAPKDSTWEKWDDVQHCVHLDDKVVFPGGGDVSNNLVISTSNLDHNHTGHAAHAESRNVTCEEAVSSQGRPRRSNARPSYLRDFV